LLSNSKAQMGILGFLFAYITTFIVWVTWASEPISYWAEQLILNGGITGVKAFLIVNMNFWVFLGFIIGLIIMIYVGSK